MGAVWEAARLQPQQTSGKARVNLERAVILLLDDGLGLEILAQIFYGFGARAVHRCRTAADARDIASSHALDLIVTEAMFDDQDGYAFIRSLRESACGEANRFTPVMVLSAHTAASRVGAARDCGANFFIAKPVSPQVIMDRLLWVARDKRQYLQADSYIGPDRRFHDHGVPAGTAGRRRGDLRTDQSQQPEAA